ncbi:hypothetical protein ACHAW6_008258 [Cyclotella cf. meneghiniana]
MIQAHETSNKILDSKISTAYKKAIKGHGMTHKQVPKDAHQQNASEKAIQTAKCHLKSIIMGCDPIFPMHLWCRLLLQAKITCTLLCPAQTPIILAYQYVYGTFNYKQTPLHPQGCTVQTFNSLSTRKAWEERSQDAWHLGTSMEHYRTYQEYIKATQAVQNCDTSFFKHHYITRPKITKADIVTNAANKLIDVIKDSLASAHSASDVDALDRLAKIFLKASKQVSNKELEEQHIVTTPRADKNTPTPRVEHIEPTPRVTDDCNKDMSKPRNLIPNYNSNSNEDSNNNKVNDDTIHDKEPTPCYNT